MLNLKIKNSWRVGLLRLKNTVNINRSFIVAVLHILVSNTRWIQHVKSFLDALKIHFWEKKSPAISQFFYICANWSLNITLCWTAEIPTMLRTKWQALIKKKKKNRHNTAASGQKNLQLLIIHLIHDLTFIKSYCKQLLIKQRLCIKAFYEMWMSDP